MQRLRNYVAVLACGLSFAEREASQNAVRHADHVNPEPTNSLLHIPPPLSNTWQ
jgi:hypothetical protein